MNFILSRIYYLPFYIPLIIEGNKNGIRSIMFLNKNERKFTDPYKRLEKIKSLAEKYDFEILDITKITNFKGITIFCEGDMVGRGGKPNAHRFLNDDHIKISLVANFEFVDGYYKKYIKHVDHVIFPSKIYAETYKTISNKNLYLGCPKYLCELKEVNLPKDQRYCLFAFPKDLLKYKHLKRWIKPMKSDILKIYSAVRQQGFKIIIKSRMQDAVKDEELKGDYYFEDGDINDDLYPSTTMNLINISSFVVYFSSSIIEECFFLQTPFIDFKLDPKVDRFKFLHNNNYSRILDINIDIDDLKNNINEITCEDKKQYFEDIKNKYFENYENTNKNILNTLKDISGSNKI